MKLRISIKDFKVERMDSQMPASRDYAIAWVYLAPHVKILLSFPGVTYVGASMGAEACGNGLLKFTCDENPLKIADKQLFQRKWPPGAWHFLATLDAVEEWLTKELDGSYNPILQKMLFRLLDEASRDAR